MLPRPFYLAPSRNFSDRFRWCERSQRIATAWRPVEGRATARGMAVEGKKDRAYAPGAAEEAPAKLWLHGSGGEWLEETERSFAKGKDTA